MCVIYIIYREGQRELLQDIPFSASSPTAVSLHLPSHILHSPDAAGLV